MSHGKNIYVLQGVLRTSDKDVLFLYNLVLFHIKKAFLPCITNITKKTPAKAPFESI